MEEPAMSLLVLGGARSGKSGYAQALAEASGLAPVYVATAQVFDAEMAERVRLHVAARTAAGRERDDGSGSWRTVDAPFALAAALTEEAAPGRIVLADCLTLWLSNLMLRGDDIEAATADLAARLRRLPGPAILVSNEVGSGIVPANALGRRFRDAQGRLNQAMAAAARAVVLVTAGLPLQIKPAPRPTLRF